MDIKNRRKIKLLQPKKSTLYPSKILANDGVNSLNWNDIRYPQFHTFYDKMLSNFWRPEEVKMNKDNLDYKSASKNIQEAYKKGFGNLTAIDVIQTRMAKILSTVITDPSINACYAVAGQQEAVHTQSYSYAILDKLSRSEQNEMLRQAVQDEVAQNRNSLVVKVLEELEDAYRLYILNLMPVEEFAKYLARGLVAMSVLEGVNFYSTFMMFYYIQHRYGILGGSVSIVRYIHKDEFQHTYLNGHTHRALLTDYKLSPEEEQEHIDWSLNFIRENVKREIEYGLDLFTTINVRPSEIETYIHWLGNVRAQSLGLPLPFPDYPYNANENPIPWMKAFDDSRLEAGQKQDFFETTVTQYNQAKAENTEVKVEDLSQLKF
ncbi:ribonucleotide-diphosphate reductase subunit beta [Collinsella aerofaciens]|uniref:ribonucleotide-diphosphate reductase subunit beta n=1 Tax=Collinsella aerofaciens TaxID=74426 RepID=UPI001D00B3B5|nr:ribonucleotide-diphosphate reductase subunit beta [Collinsella aerofaciens]MCB5367035.1 ribonucleotide-diphosphate reductase subunit beta [Collinsella aerofaciens]